jgi:hypothetical protein
MAGRGMAVALPTPHHAGRAPSRAGTATAAWVLLPLLVGLLVGTCRGEAAPAATLPADKAALLEFKAAIAAGSPALATWADDTDPCNGTWAGVVCECSQIRLAALTGCVDNATLPFSRCLHAVHGGARELTGMCSVAVSRTPTCHACNMQAACVRCVFTLPPLPCRACRRVKGLDLGPLTVAGKPLQGSISPALAALTELLLLDLSQNKLRCYMGPGEGACHWAGVWRS